MNRKVFTTEKSLQSLIEKNLGAVFNYRFVATEFSTGAQHAGRVDSLALSEEGNPVIIEYKKAASSELITQSLFYLDWIQDHKGDFELAAQSSLGNNVKVDWTDVRVICIAPNYKKYDLHAVQVIGANIELWKYRLFSNNSLSLEKVFHASRYTESSSPSTKSIGNKNPIMVAAGKKAAQTRATSTYTFDKNLEGKSAAIQKLAVCIREFILDLDESIEEAPKKFYVAYKAAQNIVCMEVRRKTIKLLLKLKPSDVPTETKHYRDVTSIGHYGTGDVEFTLTNESEFESVKPFIELAYNKAGG